MDNQPNQPEQQKPSETTPSSHTQWNVSSTLKAVWQHTKGSKTALWCVALIMGIIAGLFRYLAAKIFGLDPKHPHFAAEYVILPIFSNALVASLYAGAVMIGIKRAREEAISIKTGFQYFGRYVPTAITMVIASFIASIPLMLVNLPAALQFLGSHKAWLDIVAGIVSLAIYAFFLLSVPLVVDKKLNVGLALSRSIQLVKPHWHKVFSLMLLVYIFIIISLIPLLIGAGLSSTPILIIGLIVFVLAIIWLLPLLFLTYGAIYHRLVDQSHTN